ncbi:MAG: MBL fold metallo-hydrolase [Planctomycetota bacterium]
MSTINEPQIDIISLGTLGRNLLWNEQAETRTAHATTTLIRVGEKALLVDPALPPQVMQARLGERCGLKPDEIDMVFLTTLLPHHRGGIGLFEHALWLADERELAAVAGHVKALLERGAADVQEALTAELALLARMKPAEDKPLPGVDLFPLPGVTAGTCGLLVSERSRTVLVAGPAVPTREHFLAGQVLPDIASVSGAQEALGEVYEIADVVVPGYDNYFLNPRGMSMFNDA